jgi:hypothetical protein
VRLRGEDLEVMGAACEGIDCNEALLVEDLKPVKADAFRTHESDM